MKKKVITMLLAGVVFLGGGVTGFASQKAFQESLSSLYTHFTHLTDEFYKSESKSHVGLYQVYQQQEVKQAREELEAYFEKKVDEANAQIKANTKEEIRQRVDQLVDRVKDYMDKKFAEAVKEASK